MAEWFRAPFFMYASNNWHPVRVPLTRLTLILMIFFFFKIPDTIMSVCDKCFYYFFLLGFYASEAGISKKVVVFFVCFFLFVFLFSLTSLSRLFHS